MKIPQPETVAKPSTDRSSIAEGAENPSVYCPVCSARLESQKCKLQCRICGYYMSCSDYY